MNSQLSATSLDQIRNRTGKPAGNNIRNYPKRNRLVCATAETYHVTLRQQRITSVGSLNNHLIDSANLPIIYRFSPAIYRFSRGFRWNNDRQSTDEICESTDPNRQSIARELVLTCNRRAIWVMQSQPTCAQGTG